MTGNADSHMVGINLYEKSSTLRPKAGNAMDFGRMDAAHMESDVSSDIQISIGRDQLFYWDYRRHVATRQ